MCVCVFLSHKLNLLLEISRVSLVCLVTFDFQRIGLQEQVVKMGL